MTTRAHPEIKVLSDPVRLTVTVGGVPHAIIRKRKLTAVQGWIALRDVPDGEVYIIEYTMAKGKPVRCEYDTREKWQEILTAVAAQELFGDFG